MITTKRERIWLGILLLVGGAYLLDHLWLSPLNTERQQIDTTHSILQSEMDQSQHLQSMYGLATTQNGIIADYTEMLARIPDSPMIAEVMEYIRSSGFETGVEITSMQYEDQAQLDLASTKTLEPPAPQEICYRIKAQGNYPGIVAFLKCIEIAPRLFTFSITDIKRVEPVMTTIYGDEGEGEVDHAEGDLDLQSPAIEPLLGEEHKYDLYAEFSAYYYEGNDD